MAAEPQAYAEFTLSPDGTQLAVRVAADNPGVWIYDLVRDTPTRLTLGPAAEIFPVWTPDGQRVAFGGVEGMSWKAADGTGGVEPLLENPSNQYPNAFSPDGRWIAYQSNESGQF